MKALRLQWIVKDWRSLKPGGLETFRGCKSRVVQDYRERGWDGIVF